MSQSEKSTKGKRFTVKPTVLPDNYSVSQELLDFESIFEPNEAPALHKLLNASTEGMPLNFFMHLFADEAATNCLHHYFEEYFNILSESDNGFSYQSKTHTGDHTYIHDETGRTYCDIYVFDQNVCSLLKEQIKKSKGLITAYINSSHPKTSIEQVVKDIKELWYSISHLSLTSIPGFHQSTTTTNLLLFHYKNTIHTLLAYMYDRYAKECPFKDNITNDILNYPSTIITDIQGNRVKKKDQPADHPSKNYASTSNTPSFKYIGNEITPDLLKELYNKLIKHGLIHSDTSLPNFRLIFSGETNYPRVNWTGTMSELVYFIKMLFHEGKIAADKKRWITAASCFYNNAEGNTYDPFKLRSQKDPTNADKRRRIEQMAKAL